MRLAFSADLGRQRSALTMPFLTGASEAVFGNNTPSIKGPECGEENKDREKQRLG